MDGLSKFSTLILRLSGIVGMQTVLYFRLFTRDQTSTKLKVSSNSATIEEELPSHFSRVRPQVAVIL